MHISTNIAIIYNTLRRLYLYLSNIKNKKIYIHGTKYIDHIIFLSFYMPWFKRKRYCSVSVQQDTPAVAMSFKLLKL